MRLWNALRELEWFAVLSLVLLLLAVVLVLWSPLWAFALVLAVGAVVLAVLSLRT